MESEEELGRDPDALSPASPPRAPLSKEEMHEPAVCEMCGMVGTRDAFFSKTKRFCSVSCSRSYSSNSKKASILARLQGKPPTKKAKVLHKAAWSSKIGAFLHSQGVGQLHDGTVTGQDGETLRAVGALTRMHWDWTPRWTAATLGLDTALDRTHTHNHSDWTLCWTAPTPTPTLTRTGHCTGPHPHSLGLDTALDRTH
uniref:FCS-type domain-containing protein n=1 Tax=Lepisosteus oculatus TaxID=7918 RepID=W5N0R2_LEPOC